MEQKTTLSQSIDTAGQKAQYGTVFTKSHYEKIKKVYSVWICMNPPKERNNTITGYSFVEENLFGNVKEKRAYYDLMTAVMVCLGAGEEASENDLLRLLDVLLSSDKKATEKKEILEKDFDIPMTEKLEEEVERMCNLSDGVEQKGIQKGIQQGLQFSIETCRECEMSYEETKQKIIKKFSLSEEEVEQSMEKYW